MEEVDLESEETHCNETQNYWNWRKSVDSAIKILKIRCNAIEAAISELIDANLRMSEQLHAFNIDYDKLDDEIDAVRDALEDIATDPRYKRN